jgi:hypothetical protein
MEFEKGDEEQQPRQQQQLQLEPHQLQQQPEEPFGTDCAEVQHGAEAETLVQPLGVAPLVAEDETLALAKAGAETVGGACLITGPGSERPGTEPIVLGVEAVAGPQAAEAVVLGPCDLMPLPPQASEAMARAFKVLGDAFSRHECKASCPEGHRLAIGEPAGSRTKVCGNCRGRITGPFLTCERGNFRACLRCGLRVSAQGT